MNAVSNPTEPANRFQLPWDLSTWADRPGVLGWIVDAVDSLDWQNPEVKKILQDNPAFQPRRLLILLAYAYAIGTCDSDDIVDLQHLDKGFGARVTGQPVNSPAITRFRRDHRGLIKWTLFQCFKRAVRHHYDLGDVAIPPGLRRALGDAAGERIDAARHMDRSVQAE